MLALAKKIFGSSSDRRVKAMMQRATAINALEPKYVAMSDDQLAAQTPDFRQRVANGEKLDKLLNESFALVREAAKRTLGQRHYDVQLVGGMVLHEGGIAEMRTGEGKTLVATAPLYLNALEGKGCHLVTVNDYLARRDAEWMGQVYRFLGMDVGVIVNGLTQAQRHASYNADITYGTNNEFGFDYLRDNLVYDKREMVQRGHNFAIVDEVELDPDRRGAHAADHLGPDRRPFGLLPDLRRHRKGDGERQGHLRTRRETAPGDALRVRLGEGRGDADRRQSPR